MTNLCDFFTSVEIRCLNVYTQALETFWEREDDDAMDFLKESLR